MSRATSRLLVLAVATLVAAAGTVGLVPGPAVAAACSSSGITTVVDGNDGAGGGSSTGCDRVTGSRKASAAFAESGVRVRRNPDGSVCQVNGRPADATCQRLGDQYWALWWSNGKDRTWVYSTSGDTGLTVPANGSVAWAWQGPSGRRRPGVTPPVTKPTPTPSPTRKPTPQVTPKATAQASPQVSSHVDPTPTRAPSPTPSGLVVGPDGKVDPSGTPEPRKTVIATASDVASPSASPSESPEAVTPVSRRAEDSSDGLPLWVPATVVVLLGAAAGGVLWWRRRSTPGPLG